MKFSEQKQILTCAGIAIFTELRDAGYISMVTRGKWKLSDNATEMIRVTQKLQKGGVWI